MKKFLTIASIVLMLSSCHSYKTSLSTHHITTEKLPEVTKEGKSCHNFFPILSLVADDADYTIETARKDGDINQIASVEYQTSNFLWFVFARKCIVVKGN
ncbi:MAG: hypothetical protein EBT55_00520 [Proteobacteria bacterium]|nr:hypothetical protein [Pseudomonadota bacterium]